jgi:hypothetical protein
MFRRVPLRRITTWFAIIGYALVVSGLPLPVGFSSPGQKSASSDKRLSGKDRTKPFPCMDKPCGCATAEQCFANCCCHTPTERLAWARAHNVEAAVLAALERRAGTEPRKPGSGCCAKKAAKPAYSAPSLDLVGPDICSEYQSLAATPAPVSVENSPEPAEESPQPRLVVLRAMLACGGIAAEWFSCGVSLPPPAIVAAVVTYEPPLITLDVADDEMICVTSVPDLPPPRA